jgi:hypothetical protein
MEVFNMISDDSGESVMVEKKRPTANQLQERHTLFMREEIGMDGVEVRKFATYKNAVRAGQQEIGASRFWVHSERKHYARWVEFCPSWEVLREVMVQT